VTVFETARLAATEAAEEDIPELLDVYLSNPAYLELTEGSGGVAGAYDRGMLERDLALSALTPGRHTAVLRLRDGGGCVGVLDWMDENPNDGAPWLGLIMIHAGHQHRGLAAEAIAGLAAHGRAAGWTRLREGVVEGNDAGMALARAAGMHEVERKHHRVAAGDCELAVMELELGPPVRLTGRPGTPPGRPR
jgi:RimJ/RimL family protein N-acetyltransferase